VIATLLEDGAPVLESKFVASLEGFGLVAARRIFAILSSILGVPVARPALRSHLLDDPTRPFSFPKARRARKTLLSTKKERSRHVLFRFDHVERLFEGVLGRGAGGTASCT